MSPFKQLLLHAFAALAMLGAFTAVGAASVVYFGWYNVAAVAQHTLPVYKVLDTALRQAIRQRAKHIDPPPLEDPALIDRGFVHFHRKCVPCHGAPGIAPEDAGQGMLPLPTNLVESARNLTAAEIFWVLKNGIKMTGMPAWQFRFGDDDLWAIVAFVKRLPDLSPRDYQAMERALAEKRFVPIPAAGEGGDPKRGKVALLQYACATCHFIPGVPKGARIRGRAAKHANVFAAKWRVSSGGRRTSSQVAGSLTDGHGDRGRTADAADGQDHGHRVA